jgi:hypothetical protein
LVLAVDKKTHHAGSMRLAPRVPVFILRDVSPVSISTPPLSLSRARALSLSLSLSRYVRRRNSRARGAVHPATPRRTHHASCDGELHKAQGRVGGMVPDSTPCQSFSTKTCRAAPWAMPPRAHLVRAGRCRSR